MRPDPALLEKLVADSRAPEPLLAFAEWLEKCGEASRAELVRADVALRTRLNPAQRLTLNKRVRALLPEQKKAWEAEFPALKGAVPDLRRGIARELVLSEKNLAQYGEELLAREPVARLHLEVEDGKGLGEAAGQPWFEKIPWLKVEKKGDAAARALASAPHAGRLRTLLLSGATGKGVSVLVRSEGLKGLRTLSLARSSLDSEALGVFSKGRLQLERLLMTACLELEDGIAPLAEAEWLRPLKLLALNRNELTDEDAKLLAESAVLENLEALELAGNELTPEGALVFRSPKALPQLKKLDLRDMWYDREKLGPLRKRFGPGLRF
jgi:uncharacterized protein (TIGR02996 family)